jgi:uroporphyrinogen decarboxylase
MNAMTPRERWLAILSGRETDRIPTDYWTTGKFNAKLVATVGCDGDQLFRKVGIDRPQFIEPRAVQRHHPDDKAADIWGVRFQNIEYGAGSYNEAASHPLANMTNVSEINAYRWPSPDYFDCSHIPDQIASGNQYRIVKGGTYEPFLLYCSLRGMEQAYEDLIADPEIADAILSHIFDFFYEQNRRIWEASQGKIDFLYLAEDLGGQHGPLFSLEMYRRFLRNGQKKMADLARSFGVHIFYHTDGAARIFLPDLIDIVGIEILNPLQWRCPGMELQNLVRDFGKHIAFHGGIDNQQTLPFGTVADVRQEVREVARIMQGSRWICAPCHNIQNVSPVENVLAMYEEASLLKVAPKEGAAK